MVKYPPDRKVSIKTVKREPIIHIAKTVNTQRILFRTGCPCHFFSSSHVEACAGIKNKAVKDNMTTAKVTTILIIPVENI